MKIKKENYIVLDIETTGLNPRISEIFSFCVGFPDGSVQVFRKNWKKELERFIFDDTEKICHNLKFELSFFQRLFDLPDAITWHDTMTMSQCLNNLEPSHGLDNLAYKYCRYKKEQDTILGSYLESVGHRFDKVPEYIMHPYQIADGERTILLYQIMRPYITGKLWDDYRNEIEVTKAVLQIETTGITLHKQNTEKLLAELIRKKENLVLQIYDVFGEFINLGSEVQVSQLLFNRLKLPILEYTEKGHPSIDKDALFKMRKSHTVVDIIFKWRSYTTGIANCRNYLKHVNKRNIIHYQINSNIARTGRMSSKNPSLMNVAKSEVMKNPYPIAMRRNFCARKGHMFLSFDFKSIDLCVIMLTANCQFYIDKFNNGDDLIDFNTGIIYGEEYIGKKEYRSAAKNCTYALPYGASPETIAQTSMLTLQETKDAIDRLRQVAPEYVDYSSTIMRQVKTKGYVVTPFGRTFRIDRRKPFSGAAILVQASATGIFKRALVRFAKYAKPFDVKIVLPVHDQLVSEFPLNRESELELFINGAKPLLENIPGIDLKLRTSWEKSYDTWEDAEEINL